MNISVRKTHWVDWDKGVIGFKDPLAADKLRLVQYGWRVK